jgi:Na+/H+-dicarboxylate symporter
MDRKRVLIWTVLAGLGAGLLFCAAQPGIARADVVSPSTQPTAPVTEPTVTTVQTPTTPSAATSLAPTTGTTAADESAGRTASGTVVIICVVAFVAIIVGVALIRGARAKRPPAGPDAGR